jgi:hypothetical protein
MRSFKKAVTDSGRDIRFSDEPAKGSIYEQHAGAWRVFGHPAV